MEPARLPNFLRCETDCRRPLPEPAVLPFAPPRFGESWIVTVPLRLKRTPPSALPGSPIKPLKVPPSAPPYAALLKAVVLTRTTVPV